jgi:hypothetical protein
MENIFCKVTVKKLVDSFAVKKYIYRKHGRMFRNNASALQGGCLTSSYIVRCRNTLYSTLNTWLTSKRIQNVQCSKLLLH